MSGISYRPDIDALRGVAVLLVVIFHAFPEIIPGGFIGVDVFFVISGYLITSIILKSFNKGDFSSVNKATKGLSITVIDPIDYMCDQDRCYSYKNNNFLYADDDHFSVFGSNYVAERIKGILFDNKND